MLNMFDFTQGHRASGCSWMRIPASKPPANRRVMNENRADRDSLAARLSALNCTAAC